MYIYILLRRNVYIFFTVTILPERSVCLAALPFNHNATHTYTYIEVWNENHTLPSMRTAILRVESWSWLGMRYPSIPPGLEMVFHGFPHKCHSRVFLRPVTASQPSSVLQRPVWGSWWPRTTSVRCSGSKP